MTNRLLFKVQSEKVIQLCRCYT